MNQTEWTRDQVEKMLRSGDFGYQRIELPYGLSTGGKDRSESARRIFPEDMTGKTVLDLGCKLGYFCFEALKRGASRVLGVDVDPDSICKARLLSDCLGWKASFELLDFETEPIEDEFDYVLCLNLLHHLKNPISALEKLISVTREKMILEVAALGKHDRRKLKVSRLLGSLLNRSPLMFVNKNGTSGSRKEQKFFITAPAMENLLLYQRKMFARVDILPSEHKDRYIAIAHKRRIGRLVVVTGPTSSGKSTLMERLLRNEAPEVAERLGMGAPSAWTQSGSHRLKKLTEPKVQRLLFHYDFLRPYLRSAKVHKRDEALDILQTAKRITFLTIWRPPEALHRQLRRSEIEPHMKRGVFKGKKRHLAILKDYEDPQKVLSHYRNWFDFARRIDADHVVVSFEDGYRFRTVEEWEREAPLECC